jgi:hypothetical protein
MAMTAPNDITLPDRLQYLVKYCEKICLAECCGIDAFDFSPLHVASYLSAYSGQITQADLATWESELRKLEELAANLIPNEDGFICSVEGMNQYFSRTEFDAFIAKLRHSIEVAPKVVDFSNQLKLTS